MVHCSLCCHLDVVAQSERGNCEVSKLLAIAFHFCSRKESCEVPTSFRISKKGGKCMIATNVEYCQ